MQLELSRHILEKYSNIKFHENLFNGIPVAPCEQCYGQTDMTKITVAFRDFVHAPSMRETSKPSAEIYTAILADRRSKP
jgi:hypothetical protein